MTPASLRISALAIGVVAFALPFALPAGAAPVAHHDRQAAHSNHAQARGAHGYVAHGYGRHRRYIWRDGPRYGYGYNPGAAVAAGVIGGVAAGYPAYCSDYAYGGYGGSCDDYGWGYPYSGYGYGYGWGPGFVGGGQFHRGFGFNGGGARFANGGFGHMGGFGGGHAGGLAAAAWAGSAVVIWAAAGASVKIDRLPNGMI